MTAEAASRAGDRPRAVLIAGATASGKSALATELATRLGGAVVNADSMQVYRELSILTARPEPADEARVPHRLYGHVPASKRHSVAAWLGDLVAVLAELDACGLVPIVVGGTGLYFRAATEGLAAVPEIPSEIRARWDERAAEGAAALHRELTVRDPAMAARLRPSDAQRIQRALEVIDATGRSLAAWQAEPPVAPPLGGPGVVRLVTAVDRAELHRRIERRFDQMMAAGGLEEAAALAELGLDPALPAMRAIGVAPLMAAAAGAIPVETAVERAKAETRQYAKRQETWFRNQMPDWRRVAGGMPAAAVDLAGTTGDPREDRAATATLDRSREGA